MENLKFQVVNYPAQGGVSAPVILSQSGSAVSINAGDLAALAINVAGSLPFYYQWNKDGIDLVGQVGPTLTIAVTSAADAGVYIAKVRNPYGSIVSLPITITVLNNTAAVTVPHGGLIGQVLTKNSNLDGDYAWLNSTGAGTGTAQFTATQVRQILDLLNIYFGTNY